MRIGDVLSVERGKSAPMGVPEVFTFNTPQLAAMGVCDDFPIELSEPGSSVRQRGSIKSIVHSSSV